MKKLSYLMLLTVLCSAMPFGGLQAKPHLSVNAKADTTVDPKKHPGSIDLDKHPEVMAKIQTALKNGKIAFSPKGERTDTALDLSKHPELVKAIIKNPANWPVILKAYNQTDSVSDLGRKRQVIRDIINYLIRENIVKDRGSISSFLLTERQFTVNGKVLSEKRHSWLKEKYIPEAGYVVYYGNSEMTGKGIFQRTDNL